MTNFLKLIADIDNSKEELEKRQQELKEKQNILDKYIKSVTFTAEEIIKEMNRMTTCPNFSEYSLDKLGETLIENIIVTREHEKLENKCDATRRDY
jgi:hypothetical protein